MNFSISGTKGANGLSEDQVIHCKDKENENENYKQDRKHKRNNINRQNNMNIIEIQTN